MAQIASIVRMKIQVCSMLGTKDLTPWETQFAESIEHKAVLSDKQIDALESIWKKHFAA